METQAETTPTKLTKWVRIPPTRALPGRTVEIDEKTLEVTSGAITFHGSPEIRMGVHFREVDAARADALAKQPVFATGLGREISPENPALFEVVERPEDAAAIVERDIANIRRVARNGVARFGGT